VNFANLDLNLLVALDALLEHRSVTRAAEQMGLSQPALSGSLGRLRRHFGDELLTRVGNDYRLTPLALQLKDRARLALDNVERVFTALPDFDPATTTREFSLILGDYAIAVLGAAIAGLLAAEAPCARLRFVNNAPSLVDRIEQALLSRDLLVMPHGFVTDLPHRDLYQDEWVCLVSTDNAEVGEKLEVEHLQSLPWVVSFHGPTASTLASRQMRTLGIEPHIQVVTEDFLNVPRLIAGTRRIALLQRRLVDLIAPNASIRALPCPFEASPLVEAIWWHPAHNDDVEHAYLRDLVVRAAASVT
jgi:DNA-binding transcriptional LysR family regulator